jgi:hypothetical protein
MTKNELLELIREELQNLINEDEYDAWRDKKMADDPMWGRRWKPDRYSRDYDGPPVARDAQGIPIAGPETAKAMAQMKAKMAAGGYKPWTPKRAGSGAGGAASGGAAAGAGAGGKSADKDKLLSTKVKYKTADGTDGEATVKTLLGYAKDHPGRKVAARMYAQYMAKNKKEENTIPENATDLDERTVASREPPRKMSKDQVKKRDNVGKKLLKNKRSIRYFKDKFGDDWKSYLWAASTNKSMNSKKKKK